MTLIFVFITLLYLALIGSFVIGFDKVKLCSLDETKAETSFSIVIPFKNEADNLNDLLESIAKLNYPESLFEVILVNDGSDDDSIKIIDDFLVKRPFNCAQADIVLIQNKRRTNSPKKDAINTAISKAKYSWIVTTDADCVVPEYWLDSYDSFIQKDKSQFIVGPVSYHRTDNFLKRFQTIDFLSLIGATIGGFGIRKPFLANGANLAYRKDLFNTLNGFKGNTNIASGDDIFLFEKAIKRYPGNVHYLKSKFAVIKTKPQPDFTNLISQRVRWAAKTSSYNNLFGKTIGILVLIMNASLICYFILAVFGEFDFETLGYLFVIKFSIDFLLIYKTARFFDQTDVLATYWISSFLYPLYSVYVAILSLFKGYNWKGNYYRK
ncbi:MAG: glycosyltransferase [Flavobacteriaceae bacterium]|nr:glycosyltransferase [Flavobacteriaceae bacterium]